MRGRLRRTPAVRAQRRGRHTYFGDRTNLYGECCPYGSELATESVSDGCKIVKYTKEQMKRFVRELQDSDLELSSWERDFLVSLSSKLAKGWTLSERQIALLDRLYAEKTLL